MAKGEPPYADLHPMRVLFLIPKNPPPVLEGNFSKSFKEFVALCLNKDPEERPTAKDLLKHRFIKAAKKTSMLVDLIERRQRWLQVVGPQDSDEDSENEGEHEGGDDIEWEFETIKGPKGSTPKPGTEDSNLPGKGAVKALQEANRLRSFSNPEVPKHPPPETKVPPSQPKKDSIGKSTVPAPAKPQEPKAEPKAETPANGKGDNNGSVSAASTRPSALTSVIYPVLSKLLKSNQEEGVIAALAQLKIAFDNAERAKPGITHSLIAQIIETLKR